LDFDRGLISRLLDEGDPAYKILIEEGVTPSMLMGGWAQALQFVIDHKNQYGTLPTKSVLELRLGVQFNGGETDPAAFFVAEIKNRRVFNHTKAAVEAAEAALTTTPRNPAKAVEALEEGLKKIRGENLGVSRVVSMFDLVANVEERYFRMKAGEHGILLPWQSLNNMTTGLWPEDVMIVVARTGIGKTQALIVIAQEAHKQEKRVLFVCTEMSGIRIATRYFALDIKVPYQELRTGSLQQFVEQRFISELRLRASQTGVWMIGGGFDVDFRSIEAAIDECNPDIVFVDGLYLVKGRGEDRYEEASNAIHDMKRLAKRTGLPFVLSTQFNRTVKQKATTGSLENISLSDVVGWDADWALGMFQDDDLRTSRRMKMVTLKAREGDPVEFEANWDWNAQDFTEVRQGMGTSPQDGGYGTTPGGGAI
jgi:replicative DNA helicase